MQDEPDVEDGGEYNDDAAPDGEGAVESLELLGFCLEVFLERFLKRFLKRFWLHFIPPEIFAT